MRVAAVVALCLAATACRGTPAARERPPDAPATASLPAACELVTLAEAATLLGVPEVRPRSDDDKTCEYIPLTVRPETPMLQVARGLTAAEFESERRRAVRDRARRGYQPVPDLGDAAFHDGKDLLVRAGDEAFTVVAWTDADRPRLWSEVEPARLRRLREIERAAAALVVRRL
jgi:hypothetical protein